MSLINRNIEQKNNKILKVLDITKVDGEISELDVVEFRNEGKVYSEGTPLEANCLNNVIQEIIDNALQQRNNADYNNLSFTEEITAEVPLPVKGENGSKLSWSVTKGTAITISNNVMSVVRGNQDEECKLLVTCTLGKFITSKEFDVKVLAREMTDLEKVNEELNEISLPSEVTSDFDLPSVGSNGSSISWSKVSGTGITITSNIAIVTRADYNQTVVLKATVTKGSATITKTFNITIPKYEMSSTEKVALDLASINIPSEVTSSFSLPSYGENDSSFEWTSLNEDYIQIVNYTAVVTRSNVDKYVEIGVKATYQNFYDTRYFTIKVLGTGVSDLEKAQQALNNILLVSSTDKDITLPTTGLNGSTISWAIKSGYGISISGSTLKVTKYLTNRTIVLEATVTCGSSSVTGEFSIIIEKMTDEEVVNNDKLYIDVPSIVSENFFVSTLGDLGSTIIWDSADSSVINFVDGEAIVTRGEGDQTLPISATITYGTATITEYYIVIVLGL